MTEERKPKFKIWFKTFIKWRYLRFRAIMTKQAKFNDEFLGME